MFFKTIQNKMLFATTGKTAAEIVVERADAALPNMGLTSFKGDVVRKGNVVTSKNSSQQKTGYSFRCNPLICLGVPKGV
jgi:hypothetical protein